jgi:hypothetical protein
MRITDLPERIGEGEDQYDLRPGVLKDLERIKNQVSKRIVDTAATARGVVSKTLTIHPMPTEIVVCSAKERFGWGSPAQISHIGSRFTCKAEDIPEQIRKAVDAGGTVKAEVGLEPDADGLVPFRRFIV